MRRARSAMRRWHVAAALVLSACGGGGGGLPPGPTSFRVTVTAGDPGAADRRLEFSLTGVEYTIGIEARETADFGDGWVTVRAEPGDVVSIATPAPADVRQRPAARGRGRRRARDGGQAYGDTRIWVEDLGFEPARRVRRAATARTTTATARRTIGRSAARTERSDGSRRSHAVRERVLYYANPRIADAGVVLRPALVGRSVTIDGASWSWSA